MLFRHILGYGPANLVTAFASFASIYIYTRLVDPAEYGLYALVLSVVLMSQAIFFYWLQVGTTRFIVHATNANAFATFASTVYLSFAVASAGFSAGYVIVVLALPLAPELRNALWLGLPLVLLRSLVAINQAFHRGSMKVLRYNLIECTHVIMGLVFGLLIVTKTGLRSGGLLLGLVCSAAIVVLADARLLLGKFALRLDMAQLKALLTFSLPLAVCYGLNFVLSTSDRLLLQYFLGPGQVGVYSVSYGIVDRGMTSVFLAISLAAFPLAVRKLEEEGKEAARSQLYRNGVALLAIAIPACAGLIGIKDYLAAVLIGQEFRTQALEIMPWIAVSALLSGLQVHFFDHAFHLGKRTDLFVWSIGPAAVLNIALNIILLPRIGLMGAVYATFLGYVASIAGSILVGRRAFHVPFPIIPALRISAAAFPMFAVLELMRLPQTPVGLVGMVGLGAACYAAGMAVTHVDLLAAKIKTKTAGRINHG
jgi:O-antigen/teichoic acid export membrane protein